MDDLTTRLDRLAAPSPTAEPPAPFLRALRRRRSARRLQHAAAAAAVLLSTALLAYLAYTPTRTTPAGQGHRVVRNTAPTQDAATPVTPTYALLRRLNTLSDELILPPSPRGGSPEQVLTLGHGLDPDTLRTWAGGS